VGGQPSAGDATLGFVRRGLVIVYLVGGVFFGLVFVDVAITKLLSGQWRGYLVMAVAALACSACLLAARSVATRSAAS
jgi:uncharacterized membrane protein (UPF0136 family)